MPTGDHQLGITDEVFPPFEPVHTAGAEVRVAGRSYTMNGFGLWDKAISLDRELLARPIGLRYTTADGEGRWSKTEGRWSSTQPTAATFQAEATADAVNVRTTSTVEIDGCMEVRLELAPGSRPAEVRKLWIEIPLRASEVPLMHAIGDGLRQNHAGRTPTGTGVVWDGSKAARAGPWRNCFTPYIWLGAEERGLAWFGENAKGWVTEKQTSKTPTHELVREASRVVLRVYLINRPVTLTAPQQVRFGLQACDIAGHCRRTLSGGSEKSGCYARVLPAQSGLTG